jgi:hypothetical protein
MSRVETIAVEAESDLPDGFALVHARHSANGLLQCLGNFCFIVNYGRIITKVLFKITVFWYYVTNLSEKPSASIFR